MLDRPDQTGLYSRQGTLQSVGRTKKSASLMFHISHSNIWSLFKIGFQGRTQDNFKRGCSLCLQAKQDGGAIFSRYVSSEHVKGARSVCDRSDK